MSNRNLDYVDTLMKEEYEKISKTDYFSSKHLKIQSINNGIVLPVLKTNKYNTSKGAGGVVDEEMNYIELSAQLAHNMKNRVYGSYSVQEEIEYVNDEVVYMNYFYKHWGHFIIDMVSRLWFFLSDENSNYKIVFTTTLNEKEEIEGNFLEFLNLFGIENDRILIINKPTRFKKIIVPEVSIYPGKYYTKEFVEIFEKIKKNIKINSNLPKKIYMSRSHFDIAKKKERGEEEIESFFNKNGYVSIYPEQMSLSEQIQYFCKCEEMACISGTLPHNLVFSNDNQKIIIINKTYKINKHQELINQVKKARVTYIDAHISLLPVAYGKGPFILNINDNVKRFAIDNNYILNEKKITCFQKVYLKLWYMKNYLDIYNFKIYDDGMMDWKKIIREYLFK